MTWGYLVLLCIEHCKCCDYNEVSCVISNKKNVFFFFWTDDFSLDQDSVTDSQQDKADSVVQSSAINTASSTCSRPVHASSTMCASILSSDCSNEDYHPLAGYH